MSEFRNLDREFLAEFIQIYKENACLWKVRSKEYFNKLAKRQAYGKLLDKMKEIDVDASRETVVKKINSIRTTFRKECKKVKERSDGTTDGQYVPNLWYYDHLLFLLDQDIGNQDDASNSPAHNNDQDVVEIHEIDEEFVPPPSLDETYSPVKKKFKKNKSVDKADAVLDLVAKSLQLSHEGPLDIFGKHVACQLGELPSDMVAIAQKIINITLFEAKLGNLRQTSRIINSDVIDSSCPCSELPISGNSSRSSIPTSERIPIEQDIDRDTHHIDVAASTEEIPIDEESLILKVQRYPVLYDAKHSNNRDKYIKEKCWREIGVELNSPGNICQKKWELLQRNFWKTHDLVRIAQNNRTHIKLWRWYNAMSYLLSKTDNPMEIDSENLPTTNDNFYHERKELNSSRNNIQRENNSKFDGDSSLTLANEDEAFFISLLPTVIKFDNDEKLDFRGDVLDTVRKIKRAKNSFNSQQSTNLFSGRFREQRGHMHATNELRNDTQVVYSIPNNNFVNVKEETIPDDI